MEPYPLVFHPVIKQTIWGGRKLGDRLGKPIGTSADYAESWEVVDHGDDQSVVRGGELDGQTLASLIDQHASWLLGSRAAAATKRFPLLLKYLDCNRVLSVQVHPDDAYGAKLSPPDLGKTEAWYVVDAEPGSVIYAGLKEGVDRAGLREAVDAGQTAEVLHSFDARPGDVVFIPAGTVHAIGAGLLIAEIQQSSDTTFRLFDWNRVDSSGKSRPLHIEQSLDVSDYQSGPVKPRRFDPLTGGWQPLVQCDKFVLEALASGQAEIAGDDEFHIVTVPEGSAILKTPEKSIELAAGSTIMLPAAMDRATLTVGPPTGTKTRSVALAMKLP